MRSTIHSKYAQNYLRFAICLISLTFAWTADFVYASDEGDNVLPLSRQQELIYLLEQDCGSCHGMLLKGGLGPSLLAYNLKDKPKEYIIHVISEGISGTAMPPWKNILSEKEIKFLANYLLFAKHQYQIKDTSAE